MSARDTYHEGIKNSLIEDKDGWMIIRHHHPIKYQECYKSTKTVF
jgi:hypothetical protein